MLGERFQVVLFDHLGQGHSAPEAFEQHRYLGLDSYAHDLVEIIDTLGLRDVIAVGHSMGAMVCMLGSLQRPELFSRLVLVCGSPCYRNDGDYRGGMNPEDIDRVYDAIHENYADWARTIAPQMTGPSQPVAFSRQFAATLATIPPGNALTIACSLLQSDYRRVLPDVRVPTLIVQSSADLAVPMEVASYMHANIRGSQLRVIDADGHLPHITAPTAVLAAMVDFLE